MSVLLAVTILSGIAGTLGDHDIDCGRVQIPPEKVIGGNVASDGHWPWLASLWVKEGGIGWCTGSVIAHEYVLTAGHCVQKWSPKDLAVTVGSVDYTRGVHVDIAEFHAHPNYTTNVTKKGYYATIRDDIAIVKLAKPVTYGRLIQPICLPTAFEELSGDLAAVAGWGSHDERTPDGKINLTCTAIDCPDHQLARETLIPLRRFKDCNNTLFGPNYENNGGIYPFTNPERYICAGGVDQGVDHGDSGGPIMINRKAVWYQVGTTDLAAPFTQTEEDRIPNWFVRVTSYCPWIEEVTGGKAKCRDIV